MNEHFQLNLKEKILKNWKKKKRKQSIELIDFIYLKYLKFSIRGFSWVGSMLRPTAAAATSIAR
jgi:hypothetical protein